MSISPFANHCSLEWLGVDQANSVSGYVTYWCVSGTQTRTHFNAHAAFHGVTTCMMGSVREKAWNFYWKCDNTAVTAMPFSIYSPVHWHLLCVITIDWNAETRPIPRLARHTLGDMMPDSELGRQVNGNKKSTRNGAQSTSPKRKYLAKL